MIIFDFIYTVYTYCSIGVFMMIYLYLMQQIFGLKKKVIVPLYYIFPFVLTIILYRLPWIILKRNDLIPYFYNFIVLLLLGLIITVLFVDGSLYSKLHYFFLYFASYKCTIFTCGLLYSNQYNMHETFYKILDLSTHVILVCILCAVTYLFIKHPIRFRVKLTLLQNGLIYVCPISFFVLLQLADPSVHLSSDFYMSIGAGILLINLVIFYYMYITLGESFDASHDLGKALTETHAQLTRYRYTVFMEEQAKKERHEIKNNYFYIQTLLHEQKYEQIDAFLSTHIGELSDQVFSIQTGNILIDYIINTRLETARKHDIKTYTEVLIPADLSINEEYFCTILLNLLDNAIEASVKEKNPDIQIQMNVKNNHLVCNIKNKVKNNILDTNPDLTTTKKDKKKHGLGMKIIQDRVRKLNGIFDTYMDSNYFVASLMIPLS